MAENDRYKEIIAKRWDSESWQNNVKFEMAYQLLRISNNLENIDETLNKIEKNLRK